MISTLLKSKLEKNELTIGSWITIGHPSVVEVLSEAGFDWLAIDMEHTTIDFSIVQILISTIQSRGMSALVRVSKNDEVSIKKVMDAGADGVIVPLINNAADAKKAVSYVKYPPEGIRGVGLYRAQQYGLKNNFDEYKTWQSNHAVIIAQIEHIDAVGNIENIISTPGIDGIMIGPYDLSASMGIPGDLNNPKVLECIRVVEEKCRLMNYPLGFHSVSPDGKYLREKIQLGFTFLAFSTDCLFLGSKAIEEMKNLEHAKIK
jgi:2-dehydro-3-deoxyglucarate aldolase